MYIFWSRNRDKFEKKKKKKRMGWKESNLDLILVPTGFILIMCYHLGLWYKVRTQPFATFIGINTSGRRLWVSSIMKVFFFFFCYFFSLIFSYQDFLYVLFGFRFRKIVIVWFSIVFFFPSFNCFLVVQKWKRTA